MSSNKRDNPRAAPRDTVRTTPVEQFDELLPESYSTHVPPTALPAPTEHKTVELETVKLQTQQEYEAELRRRVTLRTRKQQDSVASDAPHALEGQRRKMARAWPWVLVAGGAALIVQLLVIVALVRFLTAAPEPASAEPVPPVAAQPPANVEREVELVPPSQPRTAPSAAIAAGPKPTAAASKKPEQPRASAKATGSTPKPSAPTSTTIDVRRDVPF